jgi:CRP/FNR family transcriptional regulator, cyclic AMP receptor protein
MGVVEGPPATRRTIRLLDYDPELAATLRPERRDEAHARAHAALVQVREGPCTARDLTGGHGAPYGVLLLDGLVNRTVVLDGVASAQLLGRGDLVRVADDLGEALVETAIRWTVLEPLSLALLDNDFLMTIRRWPELVAALFERLAAQEVRRDVHRALSQLPRVEDRIHALLWLLAERWGRVSPQGVVLRLRLTHELIGQLVGAKRPTVSLALKELETDDRIRRASEGWLLMQRWKAEPHEESAFASAISPADDGGLSRRSRTAARAR